MHLIRGDPFSGDKQLVVRGRIFDPCSLYNYSAPRFIATCVHTRHIHYVFPHSLRRFSINCMPGFKTIGFVVPALLAVAGTYADDSTTALAHLISQCKHNFAYAPSLFPSATSAGTKLPLRKLTPKAA